MFDLRYHVASLAAVFLALIIGILVGVGMSEEGFVEETERSAFNDRIAELQKHLDEATARAADLARQHRAAQALIEEAYPSVMQDRLTGKRIALVFVGSIDGALRSSVERALDDAGAPPAIRIRALKVPIDTRALDGALAERPAVAPYAGNGRLAELGRALGEELVAGGDTPLWDALASELVEERSGGGRGPADGVVVVRSTKPQQGATARFLSGFYAGLGASGAPAVGVEASNAEMSAIDVFRRTGISSIDHIDMLPGRLALVLLLAGAEPGHYGVKPTAEDGVLPALDSVPPVAASGA